MNNEPLMDVAVDTLLFLELSDDQVVEPDAAVAMMEQIAVSLQQLDSETKRRFLQYVRDRAAQTADNERRLVIERLPETLGLSSL